MNFLVIDMRIPHRVGHLTGFHMPDRLTHLRFILDAGLLRIVADQG